MTNDALVKALAGKVKDLKDLRLTLPRHESKHWARRGVKDIKGIVVHQSAGPGTITGLNKYHIGPNHISKTGAPRICYHFVVDSDGITALCNDLEDVTWSQGGRANPVPGTRPNFNFLAICVIGDFDGPSYKGRKAGPSAKQMASVTRLVKGLRNVLKLDATQVFGHYHFGKANCPGKRLQERVEGVRADGLWLPKTAKEWQYHLVALGYDLGKSGAKRDGVDGKWGSKSKLALLEFQKTNVADDTGMRDHMSAVELATAVKKRMNEQNKAKDKAKESKTQ